MKKEIVDYYNLYLNGEMNLAQAYAEALNQRYDVSNSFEDYLQDGSFQRVRDIVDSLAIRATHDFLYNNGYYFDSSARYWFASNEEMKEQNVDADAQEVIQDEGVPF